MIPVAEARARIVAAMRFCPVETVAIADAAGRVLAEDVRARADQPPASVSAMDGYAMRAADEGPRRVVGSVPAGHPFPGTLGAGEAVRIFTGGVVPEGADVVVIQEDTHREGETLLFDVVPQPGRHIRPRALDFAAGETLARAGQMLGPRDLSLIAAGDLAAVTVRMRPRIAIAATGDELSRPGEARQAGGIVASSSPGLAALVARWGGTPADLGILPDRPEAIAVLGARAKEADLLVTLGGASVGEHDLVQSALAPAGFVRDFWKVAMRPGKPLIFGRIGTTPFLGLPGNPVSTYVTALLFLKPAIAAMLGAPTEPRTETARLAAPLRANDAREEYLRAALTCTDGMLFADPFAHQDRAMMAPLTRAGALIRRPPHAPVLDVGAVVEILPLD